MRFRVVGAALAVLSLAPAFSRAQAVRPGLKPGLEHKKLEYFVGKWKQESQMKASAFGPAGKVTATDTCEWFPGGFHLVCRSEGKGPMGPMKGLGVVGYSPSERAYTYYGIDNSGMAESGRGKFDGRTWTWTGENKVGGKTIKTRFVEIETSPTVYLLKWRISEDGNPWTTIMEGRETRIEDKPAEAKPAEPKK